MESKQCAATVLGALMGFDEQQYHQHAPRHSRVLSESYFQRVVSIGVLGKKLSSQHRPFRVAIEDQKEAFGVLDVGDGLKSGSHWNELGDRKKKDSALSATYMPITRQNFINEKHISAKTMKNSREVQDLLEVAYSMDISPRNTREQNNSLNGPSVVKSSYALKQVNDNAGIELKDGKHEQAYSSENLDLLKFSRPFLEQRDKPCLSFSSKTSLKPLYSLSEACKELPSSQNGKHGAEETERKTMAYAVEPIRKPSQVSRVLDGSERKTRHDSVNLFTKISRSEFICDDMGRKDTEFTKPHSRSASNFKTEFPARDHREKLIEQKMTGKFEIPVLPHHATLSNDLKGKSFKYGVKEHVCSNKEHLYSGSPMCLSHRDDKLDQLSKNSQRFRFIPTSTETERPRTRSKYEPLRNIWFLKPEGPTWLQSKPSNRSSNKKEASEHTRRLSSKRNEHRDDNLSVVPANVMVVKTDVVDVPTVDFKQQKQDSVSFIVSETDDESSTISSHAKCTSIQQEASTRFDKEDPAFALCPGKELDSIMNLEEAYQPSPVSVLEPPFKEETLSSTESLKKSAIDCRDLMMQLELLMSESSGTNSEGPEMTVSSDDDGEQVSFGGLEESEDVMRSLKFKDSRDFSYLVDVLTEAGLHHKNLGRGFLAISPSVFMTLEKKFGEQVSWRKSERKLLFDRINTGLIELSRSFAGVPEWAKPVSRRVRHLLSREVIEEELWILLDRQGKKVRKDAVDEQLGKEIGWIDLGDEVQSICREVEKFLIEELVAEFDR